MFLEGAKYFFRGEAEIFLNDGTGTNEDAENKNWTAKSVNI